VTLRSEHACLHSAVVAYSRLAYTQALTDREAATAIVG
jgi:hypothetical protein